jgi:hypothetical protein
MVHFNDRFEHPTQGNLCLTPKFKRRYAQKFNWSHKLLRKKDSVEVSESETFESYDEKLRKKYSENWLGKGKCTGLEFKRWLALRDIKTEIP